MLVDRGIEPGKVLMGGFDIVAEVLQQMEAGYIQVQVDQQPYMQGFMPVMEAYLTKTVGLAPADIDTGKGVVLKEDVPKLMELAKQGRSLSASCSAGAAAESPARPDICRAGRSS